MTNDEPAGFSDLNKGNNISEFNAGIAKLIRIGRIKDELRFARIYEEHRMTATLLNVFYTELYERITEEERKKCDGLEREMRSSLAAYEIGMVVDGLRPIEVVFHDFERYLSSLEYKYGLSLKNKDSLHGSSLRGF